ncbi:TPA: restriction endonuclease subunit S [Streptococcus equi subsp. zooepidemicus]|nr:restriction endonuclease subunit S [Streptococcus equi subsp. zooepidemicus]
MFGDPTENPNGWTKLNVKEAVKQGYIARPLDGNHGEKHPKGDDYVPEGVPFLMAQDLKDKRVDFTSCHFITEEQASTLKKGWAKEGDVLLTHKGTIGRVAIVQPSQYENMLLTPQITYYRCLQDIDNEYLAAYFMTGFFVEQLERLTTGTTRACVTITQQEQLELIIPPVPMQREFVKFVNQSDKSKFVRFKSQFIEMFGELGKDQKGWGITTLGECCEVNPKRPRNIDDELMVSFVPMPAVSEDGKIDCSDVKPYKEVRKGFTYFAENDVLFAKITPCMENGKGAVARGLAGGIGSGSTEFHVLRPVEGKSNPYWLYIITMFESFRIGARKVMTGTGGQLRVPVGYLSDFPISLPPIERQNSFEEFVHQSDKSK